MLYKNASISSVYKIHIVRRAWQLDLYRLAYSSITLLSYLMPKIGPYHGTVWASIWYMYINAVCGSLSITKDENAVQLIQHFSTALPKQDYHTARVFMHLRLGSSAVSCLSHLESATERHTSDRLDSMIRTPYRCTIWNLRTGGHKRRLVCQF